jgi:hypothetical protein
VVAGAREENKKEQIKERKVLYTTVNPNWSISTGPFHPRARHMDLKNPFEGTIAILRLWDVRGLSWCTVRAGKSKVISIAL